MAMATGPASTLYVCAPNSCLRFAVQSCSRVATEALRLSKAYWIVCPKATAALPKINTFRDWLLAEAASDTRQLQKLRSKDVERRSA